MSEQLSLHFQYPSTITDIVAVNESFDSCVLRICYHGKNRNGSVLPKNVIEAALPTMPYCPIVTNYDIDTGEIGGHDMEIVQDDEGNMKLVNLTNAIGVVPENPEWFWADCEEDGHSYLCTKALIWKRSAAYEALKTRGITAQSMEINVNAGHMTDEGYVVDNFTFTAFAVIGVEPCFENARIEFAMSRTSDSLATMLDDFKREFSAAGNTIVAASADDNTNQSIPKGGETEMNIDELLAKFGLSAEDIANVDTTGMDEQALEACFEEIAAAKDQPEAEPEEVEVPAEEPVEDQPEVEEDPAPVADPEPVEDDVPATEPEQQDFSLTMNQLSDGLWTALHAVRIQDEYWGDMPRYWFVDCDMETNTVYAYDETDGNLYGMTYSLNGDVVEIDFASCKRKKIQYVDFEEGAEQTFGLVGEVMNSLKDKYAALESECSELRTYKSQQVEAERIALVTEKLNEFNDLSGNEMFEALRENNAGMTVEQIEAKCFEIRGRAAKFSLQQPDHIRLPIEGNNKNDEPYGGIFARYGIG